MISPNTPRKANILVLCAVGVMAAASAQRCSRNEKFETCEYDECSHEDYYCGQENKCRSLAGADVHYECGLVSACHNECAEQRDGTLKSCQCKFRLDNGTCVTESECRAWICPGKGMRLRFATIYPGNRRNHKCVRKNCGEAITGVDSGLCYLRDVMMDIGYNSRCTCQDNLFEFDGKCLTEDQCRVELVERFCRTHDEVRKCLDEQRYECITIDPDLLAIKTPFEPSHFRHDYKAAAEQKIMCWNPVTFATITRQRLSRK